MDYLFFFFLSTYDFNMAVCLFVFIIAERLLICMFVTLIMPMIVLIIAIGHSYGNHCGTLLKSIRVDLKRSRESNHFQFKEFRDRRINK